MRNNLPYNVMRNPNSWDNVPRDPVTIAAAISPSLFASGAAIGLAGQVLVFGVTLAISTVTSWALSALAPKPDFSSFGSQGALVNARDATAPADFVYGEVRKGGVITYYESTGEKNKYLHQIIVLAGHEVEEIGDIYVNDEVVTWDESTGFVTSEKWASTEEVRVQDGFYPSNDDRLAGQPKYVTQEVAKNHIRIRKFHGDQTQAPADLLAESELEGDDALTSNFVGNGIAYLYVRYEYDREVFASGLPLITTKIKGKKVYDPRDQTTAYSNNAALCVRDFLTSGYGLNDDAIDDVSFAAAAQESDELVTLANDEGTEKRYTINGIIKSSSPIGSVLGNMSTACAGTLFWGSGYWKLKVGVYSAPVKSLTLDDLRGPINLSTRTSMRDSFNAVGGTFNNAVDGFITADYPKIIAETLAGSFVVGQPYTITEVGTTDFTAIGASSNSLGVTFNATGAGNGTGKASAFLGEDGGDELLLDLSLPFTTSAAAAQRIAKLTLFRGREQMSLSADFGLNAFDVEVGDIVSFTNDRYGFNDKEFEVLGWAFASDQDAGDLRVTLTLQETSATAFSWIAEESEIIGNNTNLPVASAGLTVSNLGLFGAGEVQSDGTFVNATILNWDAVDSALLDHYEVEWRPVTDSTYLSASTSEVDIKLSPLIDNLEYVFRVRAVTVLGIKGPFTSITGTAGGDTTAPSLPTSLSAVGTLGFIDLSWVNPADPDLNFVEVWESADSNIANATQIAKAFGDTFNRGNLSPLVTRYYWIRAVDFSGNKSGFVGPEFATTSQVTAGDIGPAVIGYDNFAGDVATLFDDISTDLSERALLVDYNITVDYQQQLEAATDQLATDALTLALNASSFEGRVNDAGITVDPATGSVVIQGLSAVEGQVNEVKIDLDAVEGELSLKATTSYVNSAIAAASLPEASLAELEGLEARVSVVEIDLDSVEGSITLASTGSYYNVNDGVLGVEALEGRITISEGEITLKASQTEMDDVETRLGSAEITLNSIDAPSIALTVQDVRSISERQYDLSELTLQEVLGRYKDREYLLQDSAYARLSLTADVNDEREARASAELVLSAEIGANKSLLLSEQVARADADSALASDITKLEATVIGLDADIVGTATAVSGLTTRVDNAEGTITAQASLITTLSTTVGDNTTSITEAATSINGIEAKYGVQIDNNGSITGYQLLSGLGGSAFNVRADQFAVFNSTGAGGDNPFTIFTSSRTIDGVVYPAGTYIKDATIDNAAIVDGSITNAKIGGTIQSTSYVSGSTGWSIRKSGAAEFNDVVISRPLVLNSGQFSYTGSVSNGGTVNINFVNTGIRIGTDDVWANQRVALIAVARVVPTSASSVESGSLWRAKADVYNAFRWFGSTVWDAADGLQHTWTRDPSTLVTPDWSSGTDQRVLMDIEIKTSLIQMNGPINVYWKVYQVT